MAEQVLLAGRSMSPTLEVGDRLSIEPRRRIAPGDVIVFSSSTAAQGVCHRVHACIPAPGGMLYVHRGDAPGSHPGVVRAGRVLGVVTHAERQGIAIAIAPCDRVLGKRAIANVVMRTAFRGSSRRLRSFGAAVRDQLRQLTRGPS